MTKHQVKASNLRLNDIIDNDGVLYETASIAKFSDYLMFSFRPIDNPGCMFYATDHFPLNFMFTVHISNEA